MPFWSKKELSLEEQMAILHDAANLSQTNVPLAIKMMEKIPGMKEMGDLQVDVLDVVRSILNENVNIRYEGATRIGQRAAQGKVTQHLLIVALYLATLRNDLDYGVRGGAAWSLGFMFANNQHGSYPITSLGDMQDQVLNHLLHALRHDPSFRVKRTVAWALGKIKNPSVIGDINQYLSEIEVLPHQTKDGLDVNQNLYGVIKDLKDAINDINR